MTLQFSEKLCILLLLRVEVSVQSLCMETIVSVREIIDIIILTGQSLNIKWFHYFKGMVNLATHLCCKQQFDELVVF